MKECSKCNVIKPLSEFHKHKGRNKGVTDFCKNCRNIFMVANKYNLTEKELMKMRNTQNNKCAICNKNSRKNLNLAVDHDHKTGKVRALLCKNCNTGLGQFKDNSELLSKAIKYLKKYEYINDN